MEIFTKSFNTFTKYQTHPLNVVSNFVCTTVSIYSITNIVSNYLPHNIQICTYFSFLSFLFVSMNIKDFISSCIYFEVIRSYSDLEISNMLCIFMFMCSNILQELSHCICNEQTYLQTHLFCCNMYYNYNKLLYILYIGTTSLKQLVCFIFPHKVFYFNLEAETKTNSLVIEDWVKKQNISSNVTSHWWSSDCENEIQHNVEYISDTVNNLITISLNDPTCCVSNIEEMNEIYVSANKNVFYTSDSVFYNKHIDGPFYFFPFCSVYRFIFAINANNNIETVMDYDNSNYILSNGDVLGFDFNREIHFIRNLNKNTTDPRITLKLHFLVCPKYLWWIGFLLKKITSLYDLHARKLFLYTISPNNTMEKLTAKFVLICTHTTFIIEKFIGFHNVILFLIYYYAMSSKSHYISPSFGISYIS